jgi:hypothetical protein
VRLTEPTPTSRASNFEMRHYRTTALIYQSIVQTTDQYPDVLAAKVFGAPAGGGEIKL